MGKGLFITRKSDTMLLWRWIQSRHPALSFKCKLSRWCLWSNERHFVCSVIKGIIISSEHGLQHICLQCQRGLFPLWSKEVKLLWCILNRLSSEDSPSALLTLNCLVRQSNYMNFFFNLLKRPRCHSCCLYFDINRYEIYRFLQTYYKIMYGGRAWNCP